MGNTIESFFVIEEDGVYFTSILELVKPIVCHRKQSRWPGVFLCDIKIYLSNYLHTMQSHMFVYAWYYMHAGLLVKQLEQSLK